MANKKIKIILINILFKKMSEITTAMISKKIKNYEFPFCQAEEEHSHHHCTEICLSRSCIACFKPMCYHWDFFF